MPALWECSFCKFGCVPKQLITIEVARHAVKMRTCTTARVKQDRAPTRQPRCGRYLAASPQHLRRSWRPHQQPAARPAAPGCGTAPCSKRHQGCSLYHQHGGVCVTRKYRQTAGCTSPACSPVWGRPTQRAYTVAGGKAPTRQYTCSGSIQRNQSSHVYLSTRGAEECIGAQIPVWYLVPTHARPYGCRICLPLYKYVRGADAS
jgi:hypothetical protein